MDIINDPVPMQIENSCTVFSNYELLNLYSSIEKRLAKLINMYNISYYKKRELIKTTNYMFETAFHYLEEMYKSPNIYNKNEIVHIAHTLKKQYDCYREDVNRIKLSKSHRFT